MKQVDVLHILPPSPFGGVQRQCVSLAAQQQIRGLSIHAFLTRGDKMCEDAFELAGVSQVNSASGGITSRTLRTWQYIRTIKPRIIHLHAPPPWLILAILPHKHAIIVLHLHNRPEKDPNRNNSARAFLERKSLAVFTRYASAVICVSEWVRDGLVATVPESKSKAIVIYNGIKTNRVRSKKSKTDVYIGIASRLAADKGLLDFLEVAAAVTKILPTAQIHIAGEGPMRQSLEIRALELGCSEKVKFHGLVRDVESFLSMLHMAIFTARNEAFGLRIIEPICANTLVAAYLTGAGSDEVVRRIRSIITAPYPDAESLAAKIAAVLADSVEYGTRLRGAQTALEKHFTIEGMERNVYKAYEASGFELS